ncbi:C40 family peptidase [Maribellus sp. CM-23]|uniref:C40 family peptidase n=1 Tax=Maribellus sp. CM-23 TaxID=2781026 RepID=UPI001F26A33A|nr:C40 family peptidase [Maribellus sp. CM-23]MCE4565835.1 C40 family peptidase [Maribellus sp. CM-23]
MRRFIKSVWIAALVLSVWACNTATNEQEFDTLLSDVSARFAPDKRVAVLNFKIEKTKQGTVVLKGETNLKEAHAFLLDTLGKAQIQVVDSIRILPGEQLEEQVWGLITLSVIPMRKTPDYAAEMVSQTLMGTPIKLLDKEGGWYRIQTPDQYIGWVYGSGIVSLSQSELNNWKASNRYIFTQISGSVLEAPKAGAAPVSDLVLGCIFEGGQQTNGFIEVKFPDGREGFVPSADCALFSEWEAITPEVENIIATAKKLLGRPYLWGGTSTKGVDCSGFTKTAYYSQGVMLARDASQQALYGEQLDISQFQFQPGDLLFFGRSKERITHVGLFIGNDRFIHSSGRVKINSFQAEDEDFDEGLKKRLVAACRVLNSLNTEQIIPIKDHPWYN